MSRVITVQHILVSEFNTAAVFTLRLSEADALTPVTVSWSLSGLTADSGSDFTDASGVVTFAPGVVEQSISVPIIDNAGAELPETFLLNLFSPSDNAEIGNSITVATIIDNDAAAGTPVVSINDFVVDEATQEATFVITLDRPSTGVVSMNYATQNGAALAGSDYVATSGSLNFAAGETAKTVKVTLLNDTVSESSEAFNLVLSALSGATSLDPVGTAIIAQNDATAVTTSSLSVDDIVVGESQTYADFLVRLDQPNTATVTVNYDTGNGTADASSDYLSQYGDLTFAPGEMVKTVRVTMLNDTGVEPAQNFHLLLSGPSANATLARTTATATIIDNDAAAGTPVVSINDFVVDEATQEATFVITLDRPSTGVVSMNYATQNGAALAGSDYVATSGSLNFAAGETAKTVKVTLLNDTVSESSEAFNLVLSALSGATSLDPVGTAIIAQNDATAVTTSSLSVDDIVVGESQTYADFLVRLDQPNTATVTVNYDTGYGTTADASSDYLSQSGVLTFAPGEMVKTVRVTMLNDTGVEPAQNFHLLLSGPSANATLARTTATATIIDNDAAAGTPVVSINDFVVDEATQEATFVITLDRPSTGVVSMNYATQNGAALAGSDYVATSGSLNFAAGETAKTVKVTLLNDTVSESSEAFNLVLSALSGATSLDPVGTAIIAQNDATAVTTSSLSVDDIVVGESQTYADFLVRLDQPNTATVTVNYDTGYGTTADASSDYLSQSGVLTFAPGEMVKTVRVTMLNDTGVEPAQNFHLLLSGPSANATLARTTATATIIDNDVAAGTPVVRVGDAVVDEASGLVQVALILDRPSLGEVKVTYAVQAATAVAGSDFTVFPADTIGFAPGETAKLVTVGILNDATAELTEVFDIAVSTVTGATVGDGRGHVFISGNDSPPVVSPVLDLRNVVTVEGQGYVDVLVTLSSPTSDTVTVNYQTVAGTASTSSDFTSQSGTLTFRPGETIKTVRVTTVDDAAVEAQETFSLQLYSPTNATLGNAIASATIIDDDGPPPLSPVILNGTTAADILRGSPFNDEIAGGDGNDVLDGAGGDDSLTGGAGDDIYLIEDAGDSYTEAVGGGTDLVISYLPTLTLGADVEKLQLAGSAITGIGNSLDNRITGTAGNNTLQGGLGNDTLDGGAGTDTASYAGATAGVTVTLASSASQNTVNAGLDTLISIENLLGSSFNDALTGSTGANLLQGGLGNDTLNGGLGNDALDGGTGTDTASYAGATAGVTVTLASSASQNTVNAGLDTLISIENLIGSGFNDALTGSTGANLLQGGLGNDTLNGGLGNDTLDGGTGTDTASYAGATAGVTVTLATPGVAQNTLNAGTDTLTNIENLTGSAFNDSLSGDASANVLDGGLGDDTLNGGAGADTLIGGDGNDSYLVDNAGDVVSETNAAAAGGSDLVTSEIDYSLGANVENLQLAGAAVTGIGNSLDNRITGTAGNNLLQGGLGNDTLDGGTGTDTASYAGATAGVTVTLATPGVQQNTLNAGTDTLTNIENLTGSAFNDSLTGDAGGNVLDGGLGDDTLNGGAGADTLIGGDGNDGYLVDNAGDVVSETNAAAAGGSDLVTSEVDYSLGANVENLQLAGAAITGIGNSLDNRITGTAGNNLLQGGLGNDTLDGGLGTDTASYAGATAGVTVTLAAPGIAQNTLNAGTDTLTSIENLLGSDFNDTLTGDAGANKLEGGLGNDTLNGGLGNDTLDGGTGTDTASYAGATAGVTVTLASSASQNTVNAGLDTLISIENLLGSSFNDALTGSSGANLLQGGLGNDTLNGGLGNDTLDGGTGTDTASYAGATAGVTVTLASSASQNTVNAGLDTLISIENLIGSGFNDALTGSTGANLLQGGLGNDTLNGGLGNDTLDGGTGTDTASYAGATAGVTVTLATPGVAQNTLNAGTDTLTNIENLTGSAFNDSLSGDASANVLDGGLGDDTLNGGAGADTLIGGDGNDSYLVDNAGDVVSETNAAAAGGSDLVTSEIDYSLGANVENLQLAGAAVTGIGNSLDNRITGTTGNNTLQGGLGNDTLDGGAGTDTASYADATAGVTVTLATPGVAQNTLNAGTDTLTSIENLTGSAFNDTLTGDAGANKLEGGLGNDTLNGAAGADTLIGGDGNDSYLVDNAGDVVSETNAAAAGGSDLVTSEVDYSLGANVENLQLAGTAVTGIGNSLDNRITGTAGNNLLQGGLGNDTLDGGTGTDTASYTEATAGVTVTLATSASQNTVNAGLDTLISIENLFGSSFNDALTGSTGNNVLQGGLGNDTLDGGAGTDTASYAGATAGVTVTLASSASQNTVNAGLDTLISIENLLGSSFNDTLTGSAGANLLQGGLGNDTLNGGLGNDMLDGGAGTDTASYAGATAGVTVTLASSASQNTTSTGLDTLVSIENLLGSSFSDALTGGTGANLLQGGLGNDTLNGGLGNDTLDGSTGTDTASYAGATAGVTVTLASSASQNTTSAGLDTLISIENLLGSDFNDVLSGDAGGNVLDGGLGADTLIGGDGSDSYFVDQVGDVVSETNTAVAGGSDLVTSEIDYSLGANVENLQLAGSAVTGIGNSLDNQITGTAGNNTLQGGLGDDTLDGGSGTDTASYAEATAGVTVTLATPGVQQNTVNSGLDTLTSVENLRGSDFNDALTGDAGNNTLEGGLGNDTLNGGLGNDTLDGGSGTNTASYAGATAGVTVTLATPGVPQDTGSAGLDTLISIENLLGSDFNDVLSGDAGNNKLEGGLGNDTLNGGLGDDTLDGGSGTDTASYAEATAGVTVTLGTSASQNTVNAGSDTLISIENLLGSSFNDALTGGTGANLLQGGLGNDTVTGGLGNDILDGGTGTDTASYAGATAGVTVTLASSASQNTVNAGLDTLISIENLLGSSFNDALTGSSGANLLQGGLGNDTLNGGLGNDTLDGGTGTDTASYAGATAGVTVTLASSASQNTINAGLDTLISIENLLGSSFNDALTGSSGANLLQGGLGNDTLNGGLGNDTLDGGTGTDTASYVGATAGVTVTLATPGVAQNTLNAGTDTLTSIENLTGSTFNDSLTGDASGNVLDGGLGDDTLNGAAGADTLIGGDGNDSYLVDNAGDVVSETNAAAAGGSDLVTSEVDYSLGANVENLQLAGAAVTGIGNSLDNRITGTTGNNTLQGGLGNDTLDGGAGTDTASYADATAGVTVTLATPGVAQNTLNAGTDTLTSIENLTGSAFNDTLTGDAGANKLEGGLGNDTLNGAAGADTLIGGDGNDSYLVDNAGDVVSETNAAAAGGSDLVTSEVDYSLGANVENLQLAGTAVTGIGNSLDNRITGTAGNNLLQGGLGNDTLDGGLGTDTASYAGATAGVTVTLAAPGVAQNTLNAGTDTLTSIENLLGSDFNDTLTGDAGANKLEGGLGNDTLNGGLGNDTLDGGTGTDTASYAGATAGVTVTLASSASQNTVNAGLDTLISIENLLGSSFNDALTGSSGANLLQGGLGNDTLNGGLGNDTLDGGTGTDTASYAGATAGVTVTLASSASQNTINAGLDTLISIENLLGSSFNDALTGSSGANLLQGGLGNDTLNGGLGNDTLDGGTGTDTASYVGATAGVTVTLATPGVAQNTLNAGTDTLTNIENLTGSAFNDSLSGDASANVLDGGLGDDTLNGGAGADTLIGGDGNDSYLVDNAGDVVSETNAAAAGGSDLVTSEIDYSLGANVENLQLAGAAVTGIGNSLDNRITGTAGNNLLQGGLGNDTLDGGTGTDTASYAGATAGVTVTLATPGVAQNTLNAGTDTLTSIENLLGSDFNDTLTGDAGANKLEGGLGNDTLNGGLGNDTLDGGTGTDTASYAGATAGVTVTLASSASQNTVNAGLDTLISIENLLGSGFNDALTGSTGANLLQGGLGNDTLNGGLGNDTLDGGTGTDTASYAGATAGVTVTLASSASQNTVNAGLDTLISIENLIGSSFNDALTGSTGANLLQGGLGNDTLNGGLGNDTLDGGTGTDTASYAGATAGVTVTLATPGVAQNTLNAGTDTLISIENLTGSAFNDTLTGSTSNNVLEGGAGNDSLDGGAGSDTVDGGSGDDRGVYRPPAAGVGDTDTYKGNLGSDTLSLELTHAELNSAEVQADLRAYEEFLRLNANAAVATGAEFQFTAFALKASAWEHLEVTDTDGAIWRNGTAGVTIGSAAARTSFNIGTNAGAPTGDTWTGALPSGNDNWSIADNWQDISVPTPADTVVFNATDPGRRSVVDPAFPGTIAGLVDTGEAAHPLEFQRTLQVDGPASIHTANEQSTGSLTILNTQVTLHLTDLNVGINATGSGTANGYLLLNSGAKIDATDVGGVSIGTAIAGSAYGAIRLASNSTLNVGAAAALADINIGWNYGANPTTSVGVLDALNPAASVTWTLDELYIGRSSYGWGTATGTLRWNQTEAILANAIYLAWGGGTSATLDVPTGGTLQLGTAAAPVGFLGIAGNYTGGAKVSADLNFSLTNPTFTAHIGTELRIGSGSSGDSEGLLNLASNSTLNVGSAAALADINIGFNAAPNPITSVGVLDALNPAASVNWTLDELYIGRSDYGWGTATGTLRWNQTEAILANAIYLAWGGGTSATLDVPTGGTLQLGTAAAPVGFLGIAGNYTGGAKVSADLNFSLTNPTFTAHIGTELRIGSGSSGDSEGLLNLASNSTLNVGSAAALADINIGFNAAPNPTTSVGVLDALNPAASVNWTLDELYIGRSDYGWGTATGTLRWNQTEAILANAIYLAWGGGTSATLDVPTGGTLQLGTAAAPVGFLGIAGNYTGGAKVSADLNFSLTNPTFTAHIGTELRIGSGSSGDSEGLLNLASNSTLNVGSAAALADINIGFNAAPNPTTSVGVLDALNPAASVNWTLDELYIGRSDYGWGTATGTLRWNQTEAILANAIYLAWGGGASASLNVPTGGTLQLGTAAAPVGFLGIAGNYTGGAKVSADLNFSLTNPTFTAHIGTELRIGSGSSGDSEGLLNLASNSTLNVGSAAALADINIGFNAAPNPITSVGVLDALNPAASVNWTLDELYIGRSDYGWGTATGTLRWNQTEAILANAIYLAWGGGASASLDVPTGGTLQLGTAAAPVGFLGIAGNYTGGAKVSADLNFSLTNPTFTAHIGTELRIGSGSSGDSEGLLNLASNSTLNVGSAAALADINIGWNAAPNPITSVGVLDALNPAASVNWTLDELYIGRSDHGLGTATGTLLMGNGVSADATTVTIGSGAGATGLFDIIGGSLHATTLSLGSGTLDLNANPLTVGSTGTLNAQTLDLNGGLLTGQAVSISGGTFNFSGGVLSVDTFTGLLDQNGGVLAPGNSVGQTTVNGNYDLASAGTVKIEIFGNTFNTTTKLYDRLAVNGTVNLNGDSNAGGGGTLDVDLGYSPTVGSTFTILANDGTDAVSGRFTGLLEGASFTSAYGSQTVTFQISYSGGTGNDVVLTVTGKTGAAPTGLTVNGSADNDLLSGSVGADTFTGLAGNDIFTGGAGNDLFVFDVGCGLDRINDFSPGSDDIQLSLALAANFAALDSNGNSVLDDADANVIVAGSDTLLMFGSDQIDIVGQTALHSTDFVFV